MSDARPITLAPIRKPLTADDWRRMADRVGRGSNQSDVRDRHFMDVGLKVTPALRQRLDREAKKRGLSRNDLIRSFINKGLGIEP